MRFLRSPGSRILIICLGLSLIFTLIYLLIPRKNGSRLRNYFSTSCIDYKQGVFSKKLTDKVIEYSDQARAKGIKECSDGNEIQKRISEGKLIRINSGKRYIIERMSYSYPCLTGDSKILLDEIGRRFKEKTDETRLRGARFIVTSMTRTTEKMKGLRRNNSNASLNSPHLSGNAFDITYVRFSCRKFLVTSCDRRYLKEALAEVIWQLREEEKCWATYEKNQNCFHVVSR